MPAKGQASSTSVVPQTLDVGYVTYWPGASKGIGKLLGLYDIESPGMLALRRHLELH